MLEKGEEIYAVAGGNMFLLRRMFLDFNFGGIHPSD